MRVPVLCLLMMYILPVEMHADGPPSPRRVLGRYMDSIAAGMPEMVRGTLERIPDARRRLLAMKYYLHRSHEEIERKWAWSTEEARAYRASREYRRAQEAIAGVKRAFDSMNPGYQLQVGMEIRSLGDQIGKWNRVRSIGLASAEAMDTSLAFIADSIIAEEGAESAGALQRFIGFIRAFEPKQHPTVAVPGLSQHGQLRAFDFRIGKGRRIIAGASTRTIATVWDGAGWTAKLCDAILAAGGSFEGPLLVPYEPWHYEYVP